MRSNALQILIASVMGMFGFAGSIWADNCDKAVQSAALSAHRELLTDGTTLGQPRLVGKPKAVDLAAGLGVEAKVFSVVVEDAAAKEDWLVITDRSGRCRIRSVVHIDRK